MKDKMEIKIDGLLKHLLNFGDLRAGETFIYMNEISLKTASGFAVKLESGEVHSLEDSVAVHKVNLVAKPGSVDL